jgi:mycobactin phenyloxazoline synthetase
MTSPPRSVTVEPPDLEERLARIWAEVLDLPPGDVPADADFLRLGGDSVLAVRMSALVRRRLDVVLALSDVRVDTTLTELAAVVRLRRRENPAEPSSALPVRVAPRPDASAPFPLLPLQQGYFVGQQDGWELSYDSAHYYVDYPLDGVDGDDAVEALTDAVARLAQHQPTLRARITPDGHQRVLPPDEPGAVPPLTVIDLRDAAPDEIALRLAQLRERMSTTGPDPTVGPGLDLRLTLLPDGHGLLHGAFSLLLFDGWSTGVLTRELLALAADWNAVLDPLEIDFGDYVTSLEPLRASHARGADEDWWWSRLDALPAPPALPLRADPQDIRATIMRNREARLAPARWKALRSACATCGVTPANAMLTAFSVVLATWAGHRRMLLNSLQFNRLPVHPDVHRLVGGFASTMLLPVDLEPGLPFAALAARTQQTFSEHAQHNLVSGVEVSRELGRRRGTRRPIGPVVFQSTLGMDAAMGSPLPTDAGPLGTIRAGEYVHQLRTPQVALETRCFEIDDGMVVVFSLVEELFDDDEVTAAFAELVDLLTALADGPGWDAVPELPDATEPPTTTGARLGLLDGPRVTHDAGVPTGELEELVAEVFEELLEVPVLERSADFFLLGGDSLLVVRAVTRLARVTGAGVAVRDFLADPTVAGVAAALRARR